MKRFFSIVLAVCMTFLMLLPVTAMAEDTSRAYDFDLAINGSHEVQAKPGDVLTVTLTLRRTDKSEAADIYAMQDEIRYDDAFFEIVEGSGLVMSDVQTSDIGLMGGDRAFYMNYVSFQGGASWDPTVLIGSFQVRVLGESGSSVLKNENCLVSVQDGSESFATTVQDVKVVVSNECTVRFDPMNGDEVTEVTAPMGSKLEAPEEPTREGFTFTGWYRDTAQQDEWNFKKDTVDSNMTLYAGWWDNAAPMPHQGTWIWWVAAAVVAAALILWFLLGSKKTVRFDTDGGTPMRAVRVRKGEKLPLQPIPQKNDAAFTGWYRDAERLHRWNFDEDTVGGNMTLYAGWR
ncbi:MAG: InlB B-repeat-containing protein [Eubacteriales bacterium]|nr:InlB B-repeat-containing protein [Eubacteriales bacterium]